MDGSIPKVTESTAPRPIPSQRERRRRGEEGAFHLPDQEAATQPQTPIPPPGEAEPRPVAAPEEGEPGTSLDLRA